MSYSKNCWYCDHKNKISCESHRYDEIDYEQKFNVGDYVYDDMYKESPMLLVGVEKWKYPKTNKNSGTYVFHPINKFEQTWIEKRIQFHHNDTLRKAE